ncbi:MAG: hypothetical protein PHH60_04115 [Candidatus Margulisbacteria bacterium]|nr:hypothetical protein [Candidatus Margulisiibacteriota bacterium]
MSELKEVQLVSTGVYHPGEPVPFDKIEEVLGSFDQAPPRIKKMISKLRHLAKSRIGIERCYFAIDPVTKEYTETNVSMTVKAVNKALDKAGLSPKDIDCLLLGNLMPDHQTPPTTTLIQEALGIENCAEMEIHSNCTGISKVMQIAFDGLRLGRYKTVVAAYSQFSSAYLRADHYNQQILGPENLLLRWFLSDSASAVIMSAREKVSRGIKVLDVYNESLGGKLKAGMTFAHGAPRYNLLKAYEAGLHHFGQDYKAVEELAPKILSEGFSRMLKRINIGAAEIDHVIVTIPSLKLLDKGRAEALQLYAVPYEKWFNNVSYQGYSGASSVVVSLDEMLEKNIFKPKDLLAGITIESSKWMVGGFFLKYL